MELTEKELYGIVGGSISAAFLNALARGIGILFDIGRATGSSIRRVGNGSVCPL